MALNQPDVFNAIAPKIQLDDSDGGYHRTKYDLVRATHRFVNPIETEGPIWVNSDAASTHPQHMKEISNEILKIYWDDNTDASDGARRDAVRDAVNTLRGLFAYSPELGEKVWDKEWAKDGFSKQESSAITQLRDFVTMYMGAELRKKLTSKALELVDMNFMDTVDIRDHRALQSLHHYSAGQRTRGRSRLFEAIAA